jgi:hypothetical protein
LTPDTSLSRVGGASLERQATDAGADRRAHDALGIEAIEYNPKTPVFAADQPLLLKLDVVKEQLPLLVSSTDAISIC